MATSHLPPHAQVAHWLKEAERAIAFTGAGISTESGIPDFRSPGGVWSRTRPVDYSEFLRSAEARRESWRQKYDLHAEFAAAKPNAGHLALARWEQSGRLRGVITQNIDGLHQDAGSRRVIELHGTARWIECVDCGARFEPLPLLEQFGRSGQVPPCAACGGRLKSATISFGQPLRSEDLEQAIAWAQQCDLLLALGSSLVVQPAASLPQLARRAGARLVIINRDPTDQDASADLVIQAGIGETLSQIDRCLGL